MLSVSVGLLLVVASASASASANPHCPSTVGAAFLPQQQHQPCSAVLQIPRGGAWYFGKKTAARKYRELLEEQVVMLDKQLRQSQDELSLLRRQLKTSQSLLHRTGAPALRTKSSEQQAEKLKAVSENQELKKRVASLTKEVTALAKMRDDLQTIIDNQHQKMEELELRMKEQTDASSNLVQTHQRELEKLKREIETKYQKQLADLTVLMNKRVEEAAEHARQLALKDISLKIEQATAEERSRGEKLLDAERKRSDAAVEREKVKMRKLAKALFEREKKLNTLDKDIASMESSNIKTTSSPMASGKTSGNSSYKVDTIRKF